MKHAAPEPEPRRRWFGRRREPEPVVDLREPEPVVLADDPESVVARMARLRDAGLITAAEFEHERRRILDAGSGSSLP